MKQVHLAIDVDSGDHGAEVIIEGVLLAKQKTNNNFVVSLCGNENGINDILNKFGVIPDLSINIENCQDVVHPEDVPSLVWKNKKRSSIVRCIELQKEGIADVSLSAGDTRIIIGAAIFILGRQEGVIRPALAAFLPTMKKTYSLLLDVGANLNCRSEHLFAFGMMGYDYFKRTFNVESPSVALLNIGSEPTKGTKEVLEASKMLKDACNGFCGFTEGSSILSGNIDVVVCDGFVGNVLLKTCESFHILTESILSDELELTDVQKEKMSILNSENYGATPLIGVNGFIFKAHGSSSANTISNAIITAVEATSKNIPVKDKTVFAKR